jgi:rare lipoprotein A
MRAIFISIIVLVIFSACSSVSRYSSRSERNRVGNSLNRFDQYSNSEVLETEKGIASYYADKFHGRITYSGEVYDMYDCTAAHPTYPMGTIIRVTNETNLKTIIIPINDRMPFRDDRIVDLSYGTAEELDMVQAGIANVIIEVLEWGKGKK